MFVIKLLILFIESFIIFIKERPEVVISTGALATVPICLLSKLFRKRLIYIESFSKITTPTMTGKFVSKIGRFSYHSMGRFKEVLSKCDIRRRNILIFVTVGTQKFQFNRLLLEIDQLIEKKVLKSETVYAQIGYSTYVPKHYPYKQFLNKDEFMAIMDKSNIIITHGGTGSIINAVKQEKIVIGVPRKKRI